MNTIKASEIKGVIPEGAWRVRLKSEPGVGAAGFYKKDIEVEGGLLYCYLDEARWRKTATTERGISDTLEIIYDTEFVPEVGMECVLSNDRGYSLDIPEHYIGLAFYIEHVFKNNKGTQMAVGVAKDGYCICVKIGMFNPIKSEEDKLREWLDGLRPSPSDAEQWSSQELMDIFTATIAGAMNDLGVKLPEGEQ